MSKHSSIGQFFFHCIRHVDRNKIVLLLSLFFCLEHINPHHISIRSQAFSTIDRYQHGGFFHNFYFIHNRTGRPVGLWFMEWFFKCLFRLPTISLQLFFQRFIKEPITFFIVVSFYFLFIFRQFQINQRRFRNGISFFFQSSAPNGFLMCRAMYFPIGHVGHKRFFHFCYISSFRDIQRSYSDFLFQFIAEIQPWFREYVFCVFIFLLKDFSCFHIYFIIPQFPALAVP